MTPLSVNLYAARLNGQYEFGKDGKIQTEAYQDNLGYWTGPGGVRFDLNNAEIKKGDHWDEPVAWALYGTKLGEYVQHVRDLVTVDLNSNQEGGYALLTWNIGKSAFASSSALRFINQGRFEDAAEAMTLWVYGTRRHPDAGPDGKPLPLGVEWKVALRGLYRRHCQEALLTLGLDFDRIGLVELEAEAVWEAHNNRWRDRIVKKTPWREILDRARPYPLPDLNSQIDTDLFEDDPDPEPEEPVMAETDTETKPKSVYTKRAEEVPYQIDPDAGLKPLDESERVHGYVWQSVATVFIRLGAVSGIGWLGAIASDPVLGNAIVGLVVVAGVAGTGLAMKAYGDWKRDRGERMASQGLY